MRFHTRLRADKVHELCACGDSVTGTGNQQAAVILFGDGQNLTEKTLPQPLTPEFRQDADLKLPHMSVFFHL
jgi:hypothetical protein